MRTFHLPHILLYHLCWPCLLATCVPYPHAHTVQLSELTRPNGRALSMLIPRNWSMNHLRMCSLLLADGSCAPLMASKHQSCSSAAIICINQRLQANLPFLAESWKCIFMLWPYERFHRKRNAVGTCYYYGTLLLINVSLIEGQLCWRILSICKLT